MSSTVLALWSQSIKNHGVWVQNQVSQTGKLASQEFLTIFKNDVNKLVNLKKRLEFTDGKYYSNWENDADMLLEQNFSFQFIEWIDSSMIIKKINPLKGNEAALNLDISKIEYRRSEWLRHTNDSTTNITPWAKLTQNGYAFLVDVPVYYQNAFQGTISAGMDFKENFDKLATHLNGFSIELKDHKENIFYEFNAEHKASDSPLKYESKILVDSLDNQNWTLKLYPTTKLLQAERVGFINFTLLVGFILSFLISLLVYFYLRVRKEAKRVIDSNTKLMNANKILSKAQKKAEKASKAKTEFLSNMSHEIRTPLHAILGFIQLMKNSNLNDSDKMYIDLMDKSSTNLLSIVNDILEIDKIESGAIELEEIYFNPSQKVNDLIDIYRFHFSEKGLYVKANFPISDINVIGDQNKLLQIIINILKNALKFTVEGGIVVNYSEEQIDNHLKVILSIQDSGIGIPKNKVNSIFNRFTQIDGSLKKQHEGSGLGLAISKDLASLLGGSISVESVFNEGTKFMVTSLFKMAEKQKKFIINETFINLDFSHLKVLIVDDNKINVMVLKKLLQDVNIEADIAYNGKIGVDKVKEVNYQLVLMDIHMPEMDGYEATRLIRKHNSELVIFGLSANVTTEAIAKALECGMNNYITKPFTKERLYKLILNYFN